MPLAERQAAALNFTDELSSVLKTCSTGAEELKRAIAKGPSLTEAVSFSKTLLVEADQLREHVSPLETLSSRPPRASAMLSTAFAELRAITALLDTCETRLAADFGLSRVVVPLPSPKPTAARTSERGTGPELVVNDVASMSALGVDKAGSSYATTRRTGRTPRTRAVHSELDMPMPKTPRPEDFGISNDDLAGLGMPGMARIPGLARGGPKASASRAYRDAGVAEEGWRQGEVGDMVGKSMRELGIETPAEVEERFESRRLLAVSRVMVTTTPRMKSGGAEDIADYTADYTGLARGYYESTRDGNAMRRGVEEAPRQLNFDETPRGSGGGGGDGEIERRIAEGYEGLGVWKRKVSCEVLQVAARVLEGRWMDLAEVTRILETELPGETVYVITAALSKLDVLRVDKGHDQPALYRIGGDDAESNGW